MEPVKVWVVFVTYGLAAIAVVLSSIVAAVVLHAMDPDVDPATVFEGLTGLTVGAAASSGALLLTTTIATRGMPPARIRLRPGRERGGDLLVMVLGMLALAQALDSLTVVARVADAGSMAIIRRALAGASGLELFGAVLMIGVAAAAAEEIFFRGYMQSLLRERWSAGMAIGVTSLCFGALHVDPLHGALAVVLGVYLGFVAERSGSTLPAVACHIANNSVYTLMAALAPLPRDIATHQTLLVVCALVVAGSLRWIMRIMPRGE